MSIENMKRISQAEAEAVKIRKDAETEAKRTLDAGRKEAAALAEEASRKADEAYRSVMADAEAKARDAYEQHLKTVEKECEEMRASAQGHKEEAIRVIMGKVVGTSGNS